MATTAQQAIAKHTAAGDEASNASKVWQTVQHDPVEKHMRVLRAPREVVLAERTSPYWSTLAPIRAPRLSTSAHEGGSPLLIGRLQTPA